MQIPGFTGEKSLYTTENHYQSMAASSSTAVVAVPAAIDSCNRCKHLTGCARFRCYCLCSGGDWSPGGGPHFPCGECF